MNIAYDIILVTRKFNLDTAGHELFLEGDWFLIGLVLTFVLT